MAPSDAVIRRRAARNANGRLARILQVLDSQPETSFKLLGGPDNENTASSGTGAEPAHEGYIIHWRQGTTSRERERERRRGGYRVSEIFNNRRNDDDDDDDDIYEAIEIKDGTSREQLAYQLARSGRLDNIELNYVYTSQLITNDTYVANGLSWGVFGPPGIDATTFWNDSAQWSQYQNGPEVYIGIVDDGAFTQHNDLIGQFLNPGEAFDGVDNDNNGLIDDVYGWNFNNNSNNVYGGFRDSHGTHVSGITAAIGGNNNGIAGVASESKLIATKFMSGGRGTALDAIRSLNYLADLKERGVNLIAVNCSWGGYGSSSGIYEAISRLNTLGVLVICAAGNDGTTRPMYPAAYDLPNIISVGAIDSNGGMASYSNRSSTWVDLFAPGSAIVSTVPARGDQSSYALYNGTSMSAPSVSGIAAVLKGMFPGRTHLEIKEAIFASTVRRTSLQNWSVTGGTANLTNAIQYFGGSTASATNPPPPASAALSTNAADETSNNIITATITGAPNTTVTYLVAGIAQSDLSDGNLSGSVSLDNTGTATVSWTLAADETTEGSETFSLLLDGNPTPAASASIQDTSTTPAADPAQDQAPANDPTPTLPEALRELWGSALSDTLIATSQTRISGVTRFGDDNGRGTIDTVTGGASTAITYILGDPLRGIYYSDGNTRTTGTSDYLSIQNLKAGDTLELVQASYVYTVDNAGTVYLYHDENGNGRITTRGRRVDELIGVFEDAANLFTTGAIGVTWAQ